MEESVLRYVPKYPFCLEIHDKPLSSTVANLS